MKKIFYTLVIGIFAIISCSKDDSSSTSQTGTSGGNTAVTAITLNPTSITLATGQKQIIIPTTTPVGYEDEISWSSSNISVVTVDDGIITAIGNGTATITAYCGNVKVQCSITVNFSIYTAGDLYNSSNIGNGVIWSNAKSFYNINSINSLPITLKGITLSGSVVYVPTSLMNDSVIPCP